MLLARVAHGALFLICPLLIALTRLSGGGDHGAGHSIIARFCAPAQHGKLHGALLNCGAAATQQHHMAAGIALRQGRRFQMEDRALLLRRELSVGCNLTLALGELRKQ